MAYDQCLRIIPPQGVDQGMKGSALCCGACVGRMPTGIKTALVTDPDGVSVVVLTVCSHLFFGPSLVYPAIPRDIVMITDILEVPVHDMVSAACFETITTIFAGGRTVDDDECYLSHDKQLIQRSDAALNT